MSVKIRMQRIGRKNLPYYRIGVFDARTRRNGKSIEILGTYDPVLKEDEKKVTLKEDRVKYWLSVGAQPTEKMRVILKKRNLL